MNNQTLRHDTEETPAQPVTKADKCLNPHCARDQMARGLCRNCYATASILVRNGKTTWADLEQAGKSLPSKAKTPAMSITEWLLPPPTTE